ncbi:MAG: peptidoglycan DD-metalloendopeptidase family protein [Lachnospiraceae bacterium]|nr:peptidoglycan DD-metalloendopeptidase family protein [Lachnospiraceae bacterium]
MDFDNRIKDALTPTVQPDRRLTDNILCRVKEQEYMKFKCKKMVFIAASMLCMVMVSAFGYGKLSGLKGDELSFWTQYLGEGIVQVHITNSSDKVLQLEENLKLCRWAGEELVPTEGCSVGFQGTEIGAGEDGVLTLDLSEAYDVTLLEKPLEDGDHYYLVLTNNYFAFGQDWMVSVDFDSEKVVEKHQKPEGNVRIEAPEYEMYEGELPVSAWVWPTESRAIASAFGENEVNGYFSDHVNIAGKEGAAVYAVTDGTITDAGFDSEKGNYVELMDGEGRVILYGHLKECFVGVGEEVKTGDSVGEMGRTGMATGVNLFFAVYEDGEAVNPLEELEE